MKAAQIKEYGNVDALEIVDIQKPTAEKGQVLVAVKAASINPFDTIVREGLMKDMIPLTLPVTLGGDIAGVVEAVGEGVEGINVGDSVYGQANVVAGNSGAFAEFAVTKSEQLARMPSSTDFTQAASLPLVGVSALQGLVEHLAIAAGQKLFIHGGAGGIGSVAIQIAKHLGAYVATTATGDGVSFVKSLGADEVIDYKAEDFATKLHDFDAVFELAGGAEFDKCLAILKKGGRAVSMIAHADEAKVAELGITAISQQTHVTTEKLTELAKLVDQKVVTPQIEKVYPLDQVKEAFTARESGTVKGKIVLQIS